MIAEASTDTPTEVKEDNWQERYDGSWLYTTAAVKCKKGI